MDDEIEQIIRVMSRPLNSDEIITRVFLNLGLDQLEIDREICQTYRMGQYASVAARKLLRKYFGNKRKDEGIRELEWVRCDVTITTFSGFFCDFQLYI